MRDPLRTLFGVHPGEGRAVFFTFAYVASVVASFLLAKPIRNGLFLEEFGAYRLVYVYVGVPLVLSAFVPLYAFVSARVGQRVVVTTSLLVFAATVLLFWWGFTYTESPWLAGAFYLWVNCYGIIAPVQAWTFANAVFDTRQARRLFGLIGAGASLGAIAGGLLARTLVGPVGGTVNLLFVLAGLILLAAVIVNAAWGVRREARTLDGQPGRPAPVPFRQTLRLIAASPYLRLLAALVFMVAIVTQWTQFQFSLVAVERYGSDADRLTSFFGTFNFVMGLCAIAIQLLVTGPALRRFGLSVTILVLPLALTAGTTLILLFPGLATVLLTNAFDQGLRFSIDKASFELLYLPLARDVKAAAKNAIDLLVNRVADGVGGVLLGVATQGFSLVAFSLPGLGLGLRGIAALNLAMLAAWIAIATALRRGYVEEIRESIRQHRMDLQRTTAATLDRTASEMLAERLVATDPAEILYVLDLFEAEHGTPHPAVRDLVEHPAPEIRRRALAILTEAGDLTVRPRVEALLDDPDIGTRTEALLYLAYHAGLDPIARLERSGDVTDLSIRAGMIAFLSREGRWQNLEAAEVMLDRMIDETGNNGVPARREAARVLAHVPSEFAPQLVRLIGDADQEIARLAIRAVRPGASEDTTSTLVRRLADGPLRDAAIEALGRIGDRAVPVLARSLADPDVAPDVRRHVPAALTAVGTPSAERALVDALLEADPDVRLRVIAALNRLRQDRPEIPLDRQAIEMAATAEIMGHYRSYQLLGSLGPTIGGDDGVRRALETSMTQETERVFRLLGLLWPHIDMHSVHVGLRSPDRRIRANAIEFLDNVIHPGMRDLVVPLFDAQVPVEERIARADRLLGRRVESREEAVATLIASGEPWLRSSGVYAAGVLGLRNLENAVEASVKDPDPFVREVAETALARLRGTAAGTAPAGMPAPWDGREPGVGVG